MADYKNSVFLPRTDFPMKAGLAKKEPELLAFWERIGLFAKLRAQSKGREKFVLHDGPPYANGNLHIGHALNKILKDVINRSQQMLGKDAHYVPGWDCHGLPIEWKIEEQYRAKKQNKDEVPIVEFRRECRDFAQHWIGVQKEEFRRLGVEGDWENPYTTMAYSAEAQIVRELGKFLMNGGLYKGSKAVLWSVVEKTALAEAEVEYHDHVSDTIFVPFPVLSSPLKELAGASILIWTTTPWTIPGNRAMAYGEAIDYALIEITEPGEGSLAKKGQRLVLAKDLAEAVAAEARFAFDVVKEFPGTALAGTVCAHPFRGQGYEFDVKLFAADFVTTDAGSGVVHIAPGHGADDYELGVRNGVEVPDTVDADGTYFAHVPLFAGKTVLTPWGKRGTANDAVIAELEKSGALLAKNKITHSYPHSWRSKAPLIFRNAPQWFIAMDKRIEDIGGTLREKALQAIDATRFVPQAGQTRLRSMIEQRPDWCVSRQRAWGVPITVFVDKRDGQPLRDQKVIDRIARAVEEEGADAWFTDPQRFLGNDYDPGDYEVVTDILDVWFDSGVTHEAVLAARPEDGLRKPADLYLEGSDQHRGWFQSSLLTGIAMDGAAPYKEVLTHGFTVDAQGRKMSKSVGNVVEPQKVNDALGADVLRLWVASVDYRNEMSVSDDILKRTADSYRRIRNTLRFLLGNLHGFDPAKNAVANDKLLLLDQWAVHRAHTLQAEITAAYARHDFAAVVAKVQNFCTNDLGAVYLDVTKDRLYTMPVDSLGRRSAQTAMFHIAEAFVRWIAPVLSFTAAEVWAFLPGKREEHVLFATWYEGLASMPADAPLSAADFDRLLELREEVSKVLEPMRAGGDIGASLEAEVDLSVDPALAAKLAPVADELRFFFITSRLDLAPGSGATKVNAKASEHGKCVRCWHYRADVGADAGDPQLCGRCVVNVNGAGESRRWF